MLTWFKFKLKVIQAWECFSIFCFFNLTPRGDFIPITKTKILLKTIWTERARVLEQINSPIGVKFEAVFWEANNCLLFFRRVKNANHVQTKKSALWGLMARVRGSRFAPPFFKNNFDPKPYTYNLSPSSSERLTRSASHLC